MPEDFPADMRARLVALRDSKPLHLVALHAPRKLSFDLVPEIALRTLREFVDFILDSQIPDAITRRELADYVFVEADKVSDHLTAPIVIGGPAGPHGTVARRTRTDAEAAELLKEPNLPLDVRNTLEAQLGLPVTPAPTNIRRASSKNLPQVFDQNGQEIPYDSFEIDQDAGGTTRMVWRRDDVVVPSKIVTGAGQELPILPGFAFRKGADLTLPFMVSTKPNKVTAVGLLFRNGKVVRDNRTPVTDAADAIAEAEHRTETKNLVALAKAEGKTPGELLAIITGRSYRQDEAEVLLDALLAEIGR